MQLFLPAAVLLTCAHMPGASPDPVATWPDQPQLEAAAQAAFSHWQGAPQVLPEGAGPAAVLLTPWIDGKAGRIKEQSVDGRVHIEWDGDSEESSLHDLAAEEFEWL